MGKKMALRLLSVLLSVSFLPGCAGQERSDERKPVQTKNELVSVTEEIQTDGKILTINTYVAVPDLNSLEEITLCFDENLLEKMEAELVHSRHPDLREKMTDGYREWCAATEEQLLFSFSVIDEGWEAGRTHYLDVSRNLNGQHMGEDEWNVFTPYYMTKHIPDKLEMTPEEAAEELGSFLGKYSCFSYKPWSVTAVNCRNEPDSSGYYQAKMQPQFEDMPVYGHGALNVSACMSAEGVFTFQGIMVLKEQSRKNVGASMTLEEAVEQFKADIADDLQKGHVTVDRITAGYVADAHYGGNWTLSPAWIFEYNVVRMRPDNHEEATYYRTCAYRMSSGSQYTLD